MKPWARTWRLEVRPYGNGTAVEVRDADGRTVARFPSFDPVSAAARVPNARLTQAAPDLVRALLELLGESSHLSTCHALLDASRPCKPECRQVQEALTKAGVQLPGKSAPECPGPDCPMCSGEACNLCGAGSWWSEPGGTDGRCDHDVMQRHEGTNEPADTTR